MEELFEKRMKWLKPTRMAVATFWNILNPLFCRQFACRSPSRRVMVHLRKIVVDMDIFQPEHNWCATD